MAYQQPQTNPVRLSPRALALGFTHAWCWVSGGTAPPNNVDQSLLLNPIGAVSTGTGPGGKFVQLSGTLGDRIEVAGNPFATSSCTYLWVDSGVTNQTDGQCIAHSRYAQSASAEQYGVEVRVSNTSVLVLSAQAAVQVNVAGARDNAGGVNVTAVSVAGATGRHAVFAGGRLAGSSNGSAQYMHGTSAIGGAFDCTASTVKIYSLLFAPKVISDADLIELTANPALLYESAPMVVSPAGAAMQFQQGAVSVQSGVQVSPSSSAMVLSTGVAVPGVGARAAVQGTQLSISVGQARPDLIKEPSMAGGVANKTVPLVSTALAKMRVAEVALQELNQSGIPPLDSRMAVADSAVAAAIAALNALT